MSHPEQLGFMRLMRKYVCRSNGKVLEIGSYDVNESDGGIRAIFSGCDYTGVDLAAGPGVDLVASGHEVDLPSDTFDVSLSSECFEHNPVWRETFANMYRVVKPGGIVIITCATTGRVEHGTSRTNPHNSPGTASVHWDYYRNLTQADVESAFKLSEMFSVHHFYTVSSFHDLYFFGAKRGAPGPVFDSGAVKRGVENLPNLGRVKGTSRKVVRWINRAPLNPLSRALPERTFQNIAVRYRKSLLRVADTFGVSR